MREQPDDETAGKRKFVIWILEFVIPAVGGLFHLAQACFRIRLKETKLHK